MSKENKNVIKKEADLIQFAIKQFVGNDFKVDLSNWNCLMKIIEKVEKQHNGAGIPLRTSLATLETSNDPSRIDKYEFCITFNQHPRYHRTSTTKEYCVIMTIGDYCKDLYISNQIK